MSTKANDVVGADIDGFLTCSKCLNEEPMTPGVEALIKPIKRGDLKNCPWMECECCGCPLELR